MSNLSHRIIDNAASQSERLRAYHCVLARRCDSYGPSEGFQSSMTRDDYNYADRKTDVFALGSTISCIMIGNEIFPDLIFQDEGTGRDSVAVSRPFVPAT